MVDFVWGDLASGISGVGLAGQIPICPVCIDFVNPCGPVCGITVVGWDAIWFKRLVRSVGLPWPVSTIPKPAVPIVMKLCKRVAVGSSESRHPARWNVDVVEVSAQVIED